MDEGLRTLASRVDADLSTLDDRVTRRRHEVEKTDTDLQVAQGRIEVLEERLRNQHDVIEKICARLTVVEDNLCHCRKENQKPTSPLLGSPIVLGGPLTGCIEGFSDPENCIENAMKIKKSHWQIFSLEKCKES